MRSEKSGESEESEKSERSGESERSGGRMREIIIGLLLLAGVSCGSDIAFNGTYWAMTYYKGKIDFSEWEKSGVNSCMIYQDEDDSKAFTSGFPYYNEYVLPQIGWDSKAIGGFEFICRKYFGDGERKRLNRNPSLSDPEYWLESKKRIQQLVSKKKAHNPLAYSLGDECSVTSYVKPFDFDFSEHALLNIREWLKKEYGSLEELNKEWETNFSNWDNVVPFTTDEAKERQNTGNENFSPWADHRTFMEISFAEFLEKCRKYSEEIDPKTPVGLTGCQMPSCFGGYDWWRLSRVMTFVEAYDIGNSVEILRSFTDNNKVFKVSTTFTEAGESKRKIWERLLQGERGTIIYDESVNKGENKVVTGLKEVFLELNNGISKKILSAERKSDPIAIHYSQSSIHAQWMLETGPDKKRNWISWSERQSSRFAKNRNGWVKVIKDLGLQFKFVSYEQVENGELIRGGYKVFIMPQSTAISQKETKAIEEFVGSGGLLIGDCQIATMDQHCKRLKEGQLDKLFGIKRNGFKAEENPEYISLKSKKLELKAAEPSISLADASAKANGSAAGVPVVIIRNVGRGRTVYLNFYLSAYPKLRLQPPKEKSIRDIIEEILTDRGIKSRAYLTTLRGEEISGHEIIWFKVNDKEEYLSILRNAEVVQDELGASKELVKSGGKYSIKITLPAKGKIIDLRANTEIGVTETINVTLDPYEPAIYSIVWQ